MLVVRLRDAFGECELSALASSLWHLRININKSEIECEPTRSMRLLHTLVGSHSNSDLLILIRKCHNELTEALSTHSPKTITTVVVI